VGSAAVQIAALRGARVTAVVRTLAHDAELRALGAHDVIVTDQVTNVDAVDVVLELVGAAHLELVQGRLAPGGRVVVIGVGAGSRATIDLLGLMQRRALVTGSTLRARSREEKSHVAAAVSRDLATGWADGRIRVPAVTTFDLDNVEAAYDYFSTPGKFGKVVLVTSAASHP
jgi:NADPH:quinone reductase-like Zn-dependent oxidoreductase